VGRGSLRDVHDQENCRLNSIDSLCRSNSNSSLSDSQPGDLFVYVDEVLDQRFIVFVISGLLDDVIVMQNLRNRVVFVKFSINGSLSGMIFLLKAKTERLNV